MAALLIVEDEAHIASGLCFNLEAEGHTVQVVDSGEAALAVLADASLAVDLIVLDIMLPGIDGFAVAAALRQRGCFTPILMLTARGRPEDVLHGFEAGADDYLPKPFELRILLARVNALLRRHACSGRELWHGDARDGAGLREARAICKKWRCRQTRRECIAIGVPAGTDDAPLSPARVDLSRHGQCARLTDALLIDRLDQTVLAAPERAGVDFTHARVDHGKDCRARIRRVLRERGER